MGLNGIIIKERVWNFGEGVEVILKIWKSLGKMVKEWRYEEKEDYFFRNGVVVIF